VLYRPIPGHAFFKLGFQQKFSGQKRSSDKKDWKAL